MPLLTYFFLELGWPWVGEFVGFIIMCIFFPTQQNLVDREHPNIGLLAVRMLQAVFCDRRL